MSAPDSFSGKSVRCPKCGSPVTFSRNPSGTDPQANEDDFEDLLAEDESKQQDEWEQKAQKRRKRESERKSPSLREVAGSRTASGSRRLWIAGGAALVCLGIVLAVWFAGGNKDNADPQAPAIAIDAPEAPPVVAPPVDTSQVAAAPAPADAVVSWPERTSIAQINFSSGSVLARQILRAKFDRNAGSKILLFEPSYFEGDEKAWREVTYENQAISGAAFKRWKGRDCLLIITQRGETVLFALIDAKTFELVPTGPDLINPVILEEVFELGEAPDPLTSLSVTESDQDLQVAGVYDHFGVLVDLESGKARRLHEPDTISWNATGRYLYRDGARFLNTNRGINLNDARDYLAQGLGDLTISMWSDPYDQMRVAMDIELSSRSGIRPTSSLGHDLRMFPEDVNFQGYMRQRPWLLASDPDEVLWLSRESCEIVARRPWPVREVKRIYDDPANQRLIAIGSNRAGVVKYDNALFPPSDALVVTIDLPARIAPGQRVSVPIQTPTSDLEVSLLEGPASARIEAGSLIWTPTVEEVGPSKLKFRLVRGVDVRDQQEEAIVSRFPLRLPFEPDGFRVTADGKRVVIWQLSQRDPFESGPPRMAVYDLEQQRVVSVRALPYYILDVAIVGDQVVIKSPFPWGETREFPPQNGEYLAIYRLPDLAWVDTHHFKAPIESITPVGPSSLAVRIRQEHGDSQVIWPLRNTPVRIYRIPEMTVEPWSHLPSWEGGEIPRDAAGRWIMPGLTMSADASQVEGYNHPGDWCFRNPSMVGNENYAKEFREKAPDSFQPGQLAPGRRRQAVEAWVEWKDDVARLPLELPGGPRVIPVTHSTREKNTYQIRSAAKPCARGILCLADGLHLIPQEELEVQQPAIPQVEANRPEPIVIHPAPNSRIVESGDRLKFEISGGTPPYEVKYFAGNTGQFDSFEVDPVDNDRAVIVKFNRLMPPLDAQLSDLLIREIGFPGKEPQDILKEYLLRMNEEFGPVFGKPVQLPILPSILAVIVTDANQQKHVYQHSFFVQFPPGDLLKRMKDLIQQGGTPTRAIGLTPRRRDLPMEHLIYAKSQTVQDLSRELREQRNLPPANRSRSPEEYQKLPPAIQAALLLTGYWIRISTIPSYPPETEIRRTYNSVTGKLVGAECNFLIILDDKGNREKIILGRDFAVHPTIWGAGVENADMLISTGVVFSGTTNQRRNEHVRSGIVSGVGIGWLSGARHVALGIGGGGAGAGRGSSRALAMSGVRVFAGSRA